MHLKVVVFPAPFNPKSPKHSPGSTQKFKLFIAIISCSLEQHPPFLKTFLIFFNLTEYSLLFDIPFSLVTPILSELALSISCKTRLSSILVFILSSEGLVYEYEYFSIINNNIV